MLSSRSLEETGAFNGMDYRVDFLGERAEKFSFQSDIALPKREIDR